MADDRLRGVLVLFEGLPPTVIDSQVLSYVRLVREQIDIDLAVVAVAGTEPLFEASQKRLDHARDIAGGEVLLLRGVRPARPGSLQANRWRIAEAFDRLGPISFVQARADYAAAVTAPLMRSRGIPTLWDCRGDGLAEFKERMAGKPAPLRLAAAVRAAMMRRDLRVAGAACAGACFVTPQLRDRMSAYLHAQPSWIIPCLAPETTFFFDSVLRDRMRQELAIDANETVFIYTGSLAPYQGFDTVIVRLGEVLASGARARLVVLTPDFDRARQKCAGLPADRLTIRSVSHSEVPGYLNAADFGLLLREDTPVNHVAFPTKFAEYALTGLKVVMKEAPPACVAAAKSLGNHVALGEPEKAFSPAERAACAAKAVQSLGRIAAMPTYAEIYRSLAGQVDASGTPLRLQHAP